MMECERISDLFSELHDDEADGEIKDVIRDHLYNCPGCREEYKWYTLTVQALGSLETASPPEDFVAQLNTRLYSEPSPNPIANFFRNLFSGSPSIPLPVGAAALVLLATAGLAFYNTTYVFGPVAPVAMKEPAASHTGVLTVAQPGGIVAKNFQPSPAVPHSQPLSPVRNFLDSHPRSSANPETAAPQFPTIADLIGADNLTVESPSVDQAVESLKKMLPNIQGRLVNQEGRGKPGDIVLAVLIPSDSYGHLTTELINHGAVVNGMGPDDSRRATKEKDGNNVLLYIRFVSSR